MSTRARARGRVWLDLYGLEHDCLGKLSAFNLGEVLAQRKMQGIKAVHCVTKRLPVDEYWMKKDKTPVPIFL